MTRVVPPTHVIAAVITSLIAGASAHAENVPRTGLEEITVTAQRREEHVQDVPISMNVISAADLEKNLIFDFVDTVQLTPGVLFNTSSPAFAAITLRGVGPAFFSTAPQGVPIFVDEVAAAQPGMVWNTMVDVERVELLRGPQGTLYGKNAPSGAYNITTVRPSHDGVSGSVEGTVAVWESNGEPAYNVRGALNVPIWEDRIAMRISGVYSQSDGPIDMKSPFRSAETTGGNGRVSVRARVLWEISEDSELHVTGGYQNLKDYYGFRAFEGQVQATGGSNAVPAIFSRFRDRDEFSEGRSGSTTETSELTLRYALETEITNFVALASYQNFETTLFQQQEPWPIPNPAFARFLVDTEQTTLELRVADETEWIDYVGGFYGLYSDSNTQINSTTREFLIPNEVDQRNIGLAGFANVTVHLAEKWDLSGGLRYDYNELNFRSDVNLAGVGTSARLGGVLNEKVDFDHLSWSVKVRYFASENTTAYFAVDNAYREGGANSYVPILSSIGGALNSDAILSTIDTFLFYDEEVSTSFELGVKGSLWDQRVRYNIAAFYQQFDDHILLQLQPNHPEFTQVSPIYTLLNVNADEVVTYGTEFDLAVQITEELNVDFRAAYSNPTVEKWDDRVCAVGLDPVGDVFCPAESGTQLNQLPRWNTNLQVNYSREVVDDWWFISTMSWNWRSKVQFEGLATEQFNHSINVLNLNLGVTNGAFSVRLFARNLTDQLIIQTPFFQPNGDPTQPEVLVHGHSPNGRQFGVTMGYQF